MKDALLTGFLEAAGKYGKLVRPDSQEADDLICDETCPGCLEKLRWHTPDGIYGRVFFVCDTCDRWFLSLAHMGAGKF